MLRLVISCKNVKYMLCCSEPYCIALYDYVPQCAGDLAFKEGDRIKILRKVDSNWIEGEFFGSNGIFPSNFVRIEQDLPTSSSAMAGFQSSHSKDMRRVVYSYQASSNDELSVNVSGALLSSCFCDGWIGVFGIVLPFFVLYLSF